MRATIIIFFSLLAVCWSQINLQNVRHRVVVQSAAEEAQLPSHLLNPFYRDRRVLDVLARSSWFGPGETPVYARETDTISRRDIYIVLKHAGLLPQQQHQ